MKKKVVHSHWFFTLLATCGYIGFTPIAPGTATSIVAMVAFYLLPITSSSIAYFIILNLLLIFGILISGKVAYDVDQQDPSFVVIDEWVGMWLTLLFVPKSFWIFVLGLVFFRIFDILKPWPISSVEKKLAGGLGIMLDDVVAGLFACGLLHGVLWVVNLF